MQHRPRKRFGQHFLHDQRIIGKILAAIAPQPGERLLEIGPGLGAISLPLLERCGALTAIELDRDVIPELQAAAAGKGELRVIQGDALKADISALAPVGEKLRLLGNLPYNISTPLLFHFLEHADRISDMHFMLQKEVVTRMAAGPGGKEYGRLTVMLAARCKVQPLFNIGSGAFRPPPKVESSFVRLTPHKVPPFPITDPTRFAQVVAQAFSHRRKTLRNALAGLVEADAMLAAGIDPQARPETLSAKDFARLSA
ncbi:MAG TPA: 16S rRNA (adenine(1518)-N(6)/adenine(1519)-N(6))-dimethyltransferase RsmA [Gammaproteobacteria bacterium]|jgi:16S rRNA (adenine1518-N6/adenine1519-N6)-dimethyltransferase|nr:16S rRNA (adenine(1518)-N(6)/adenine(1519)-N(6))-dimethyltransferase RsmA [Gammaproteobacteria bacterium]